MDRFLSRSVIEPLEVRRLLAGWVVGPQLHGERSVSFHYDLDETGYHWEATIGDMGEPNVCVSGRRFRAEFDPTIEHEGMDDNPDPDAFMKRFRAQLEAEYNRREADRPVTFRLVRYDDGSFEIAGLPPRQSAPVIVDGGLLEGILTAGEPDQAPPNSNVVNQIHPDPKALATRLRGFETVADALFRDEGLLVLDAQSFGY